MSFIAVIGCGTAPDTESEPAPVMTAVPPFPRDADTLTSFTVVGRTAEGQWTVVKRGQISKGAQWKRLFDPSVLAESDRKILRPSSGAAIESDTCEHGSAVVLNDGVNFAGNYLCFTTGMPSAERFDLATVDSSFVVRSAYAVAPVVIYDVNDTPELTWCNTDVVQQERVYAGPPIRYLQVASDQWGPCQVSAGK